MRGWMGSVLICVSAVGSDAQTIRLGFIGDDATFGDYNKTAFKWAKSTFTTEVIKPADLPKAPLTNFAVLWWQDGDTDPRPFMTDAVKKALGTI